MARFFLVATVLVLLSLLSVSSATICETYSGTTTNSTLQVGLMTAIVTRAAVGSGNANITSPTTGLNYTIQGLFNSSGPLYNLFSGRTMYRVNAPDYTTNTTALSILATKLVAYFGALFGCNAAGFPTIANTGTYNQFAVHANMGITQTMETYFITQLALTLYSFGVSAADVNTAAVVLGYFGRCGAPITTIGDPSSNPVQVCGDSSCTLATGASYQTCIQYYSYPTSSSSASIPVPSSSSSSSSSGSNGATGKYAVSGLFIAAAAIVASLVL